MDSVTAPQAAALIPGLILTGRGFTDLPLENVDAPIDQTKTYLVALRPIELHDAAPRALSQPIIDGIADLTWCPGWSIDLRQSLNVLATPYSTLDAMQLIIAKGQPLSDLFAVSGKAAWRAGVRSASDLIQPDFWVKHFPALTSQYVARRLYKESEICPPTSARETRRHWREAFAIEALFPYWEEGSTSDRKRAAAHCALAWKWLADEVSDAALAQLELEIARDLCPSNMDILANWAITRSICGEQSSLIHDLKQFDADPKIRELLHALNNRSGVEPPINRSNWIPSVEIDPSYLPNEEQKNNAVGYDLARVSQTRFLVVNGWNNVGKLHAAVDALLSNLRDSDNVDLHILSAGYDLDAAAVTILEWMNSFGNESDTPDITIDETEDISLLPLARYSSAIDLSIASSEQIVRDACNEMFAPLRNN